MFISFCKVLSATLLTLCFFGNGDAQQQAKDACHVYVIDIAKAKHALKPVRRTNNAPISPIETTFPEFHPTIGEEEMTTKHYPFPNSKLIITASVFYTDESMASHGPGTNESHNDSMLIGLTVSNRARQNAIDSAAGNNTITEVTYSEYTNKVRAQKYVNVSGRVYLVGIECDCISNRNSK